MGLEKPFRRHNHSPVTPHGGFRRLVTGTLYYGRWTIRSGKRSVSGRIENYIRSKSVII